MSKENKRDKPPDVANFSNVGLGTLVPVNGAGKWKLIITDDW